MRRLFVRVGPGNHRARLAVAEVPVPQQIATMPRAHLHPQLVHVRGHRLDVPQIAAQAHIRGFARFASSARVRITCFR